MMMAKFVVRWVARVSAYWMSLRDDFPPFSLSAEAGPATNKVHVLSGVGGLVLTGGAIGGIIAVLIATSNLEDTEVSYAGLLDGEPSPTLELQEIEFTLLGVDDRYEFADGLFIPEDGDRFVSFTAVMLNVSKYDEVIYDNDFRLKDPGGNGYDPVLVSYGGSVGEHDLKGGAIGYVRVIFEMPRVEEPEAFEFEPDWLQRARFEFTK